MTEKRAQRRLAAILAADAVGCSRLMEQDEAGTLAALKARRQDVLAPLVAQRNGHIVKVMGDGVLVEFGSAVDAKQCTVQLLRGVPEFSCRRFLAKEPLVRPADLQHLAEGLRQAGLSE